MSSMSAEMNNAMAERFGKDSLLALATVENGSPYTRAVNAYYENGAFYVITNALLNKMRHINNGSAVGICGEWFTGHAYGISLEYFCKKENKEISDKLKNVFSAWINNGHNNFEDENTIILCLKLTDGVLFVHGTRYEFSL